jgi:hypothetical protein
MYMIYIDLVFFTIDTNKMKKNENSTTSKQFKNPIENSQKHGNLYSQHTYIYMTAHIADLV